jgi:hypothetical protein
MKTVLNKMKRSNQDIDWISANKEIKLSEYYCCKSQYKSQRLGYYFSHNRLLAIPIFYGMMAEKRLFYSNSCILGNIRVTMNIFLSNFTN